MRRFIDPVKAFEVYQETGSVHAAGARLGFSGPAIWSAIRRAGFETKSTRPPALRGEDNPSWKGDAALDTTKRARIQRVLRLDACERCGKAATDRHHKDGDTGHNERSNLELLCRRCHMKTDGRLDRFLRMANAPKPHLRRPPSPCSSCGVSTPSGKRRKGRCPACSEFFRRNGRERLACHKSETKKLAGARASARKVRR